MAWVSPTGFNDPDGEWADEANMYDEDTASYAVSEHSVTKETYSGHWLELTHVAINCNKVQIYSHGAVSSHCKIDLYYDDAWHNIVTDGALTPTDNWHEFSNAAGTKLVTAARIDIKRWDKSDGQVYTYEFDFWEAPPVTEKTDSDTGSGADAKASGNPLATYSRSETGSGVEAKASGNPLAALSGSDVGSLKALFEYYNTGDNSATAIHTVNWKAQTFTPTAAHKITSVKLKLYRVNLPGTVTVSIRATSGNHPTGSDLCSGTTDGNTLTTDEAGEWREITLGAGYNLDADTKYAIVARALDAGGANELFLLQDTSGDYAGGNKEVSDDSSSSWATWAAYDLMFEDWGVGEKALLVVALSKSETGTGVEGMPARGITLPDSGSGVDAILNFLATLVKADSGVGVEHILDRAMVLTETGSGVDTILSLLGKKVSETGSGVENSYLHILEGVKSSSDTGEGADASTLEAQFQRAEAGVGAEVVAARAIYAKEYPTGAIDLARVLTAAITGTGETGTGAEASLKSVYLKGTETGAGVDASTLTALFSRDDVGAGAEAITLLAAMVSHDTGVGVEAVIEFFRKLIDSGQGEENLHLIGYVGRAMKLITYLRAYSDLVVYTKPYSDLRVYTSEVKKQ